MKTIFRIVSVLAIANVLAFAAFVGWLQATDRLSKDRVRHVRELFAKTVTQESADAAAGAQEKEQKKKEEAKVERMAVPPVPAAEQIAEHQQQDEHKLQTALRQEQELTNLRSALESQLAALEARQKKFADEKAAFEKQRQEIAKTEGTKQFQTALETLQGQKPKDAKAVLKSLIDRKETDQVVAYLAKMDDDKRSKVMAEFVKDDPALAADLLERLRTRGLNLQANTHDPQLGKLSQTANSPGAHAAAAGNAGGAGSGGGAGGR